MACEEREKVIMVNFKPYTDPLFTPSADDTRLSCKVGTFNF